MMHDSQPLTAASVAGTAQNDPFPLKPRIERRCNIWVHDDNFSKDEVVLNMDLFPEVEYKQLMAIVALKTDSQDKAQTSKTNVEFSAPTTQSNRGHTNPRSPVYVNGSDVNHDVDQGKQYLFIAKDMQKEMKLKHPSLEISVAKHVADVFGLKHRSSVLVTTVSYSLPTSACLYLCEFARPTLSLAPPRMSSYPSKTSISLDLICGDWQLESSAIKRFSKVRRSSLWEPSRRT
jgi:hypothetical protein